MDPLVKSLREYSGGWGSVTPDQIKPLIEHLERSKVPDKAAFTLCVDRRDWMMALIAQLTSSDLNARDMAANILTLSYDLHSNIKRPPTDIFDKEGLEFVQTVSATLEAAVDKGHAFSSLESFDILVRLLGRNLHSSYVLVNGVMKIVEKSLKPKLDPTIWERAFKSWAVLLDNFAIDDKISGKKFVALILRPVLSGRHSGSDVTKAKLNVWWKLLNYLGDNVYNHCSEVVQGFLHFCYGVDAPAPASTHDAISTTPTKNRLSVATTPSTPVNKYSEISKICLEGLVQMFALRPLHDGIPKPVFFKPPLTKAVIKVSQIVELSDSIFPVLKIIAQSMNPGLLSEQIKVISVWKGISRLVSDHLNTKGDNLASEDVNLLQTYLTTIKTVFITLSSKPAFHRTLYTLMELVLQLPPRLLQRPFYQEKKGDPKISPVLFVISAITCAPLFNDCESVKDLSRFLTTLSTHVNHPDLLGDALHKMEVLSPMLNTQGLETLSSMWEVLARRVSTWRELAKVKQNQSHSFHSVLQFLRFPLQFLTPMLTNLSRNNKLWKDWGSLYSLLEDQSEMIVGYGPAQVCSEMTERLSTILKASSKPYLVDFLICQVKCVDSMREKIPLSSLAREIKSAASAPLGAFKRQLSPLGNATSLVNHLNHILEALDHVDKLASNHHDLWKLVIDTYSKLYVQVVQAELMKPLFKLTLGPMAANLFAPEALSRTTLAGCGPDALNLFDVVCTQIKTKYQGPYNAQLLEIVEPLLLVGFESEQKKVRNKTAELWQLTFGTTLKKGATLSERLSAALKTSESRALKKQMSLDSQDSETNSFPSMSEFVDEPAIEMALKKTPKKGSTPVKSSGAALNSPSRISSPGMKPPSSAGLSTTPNSRRRSGLQAPAKKTLEEEDSQDFVVIKSAPKRRRPLTEHQKDVLTSRHDDIPALYSELSRDDSMIQLPSQFMTQSSFEDTSSMSNSDLLLSKIAKQRESVIKQTSATLSAADSTSNSALAGSSSKSPTKVESTAKKDDHPAVKTDEVEKNEGSKASDTAEADPATSEKSEVDDQPATSPDSQSLLYKAKAEEMKRRKNARHPCPLGLRETVLTSAVATRKRKPSASPKKSDEGEPENPAITKRKKMEEVMQDIFGTSPSESETDVEDFNSVEIIEKPKDPIQTITLSSGSDNSTPTAAAETPSSPMAKNAQATYPTAQVEVGSPRRTSPRKKIVVENEEVNLVASPDKEPKPGMMTNTEEEKGDLVPDHHGQVEDEISRIEATQEDAMEVGGNNAETEEAEFKENASPMVDDDDDEIIIGSSQPPEDYSARRRTQRERRSSARRGLDQDLKDAASMANDNPEQPKSWILNKRNAVGETVLHQAAKKGDFQKVKELLIQGADPDVPDAAGWYPLHELAISKKPSAAKIMSLIVNHGCDVNCMARGLTPLHEAVLSKRSDLVSILLDAGADPNIKNSDDQTALDLADSTEMTALLRVAVNRITTGKAEPKQANGNFDLVAVKESPAKTRSPAKKAGGQSRPSLSAVTDSTGKDSPAVLADKANNVKATSDATGADSVAAIGKDSSGGPESPSRSSPRKSPRKKSLPESNVAAESTATSVPKARLFEQAAEKSPAKSAATNLESNKENLTGDSDVPMSEDGAIQPTGEAGKDKEGAESDGSSGSSGNSLMDILNAGGSLGKYTKVNKVQKRPVLIPGVSRGALLLNLSRRKSLEGRDSPGVLTSPGRRMSGASTPSSANSTTIQQATSTNSGPWHKYNPSPSHASPSASILKRKREGDDLNSSTEGSPLSSGKRRHVRFNENPVTDSVEIPRSSEGKTRKKLKLMINLTDDSEETSEASEIYKETPPLDVSVGPIYPDLSDCQAPVSEIIHLLACSNTFNKVLAASLKDNKIKTIGDLAKLEPALIRNIRGIKPVNTVTVKNVLTSYDQKVKRRTMTDKELLEEELGVREHDISNSDSLETGAGQTEAEENAGPFRRKPAKAPVEDITSQEEEEKIKEALFLGPSPSPTSDQQLSPNKSESETASKRQPIVSNGADASAAEERKDGEKDAVIEAPKAPTDVPADEDSMEVDEEQQVENVSEKVEDLVTEQPAMAEPSGDKLEPENEPVEPVKTRTPRRRSSAKKADESDESKKVEEEVNKDDMEVDEAQGPEVKNNEVVDAIEGEKIAEDVATESADAQPTVEKEVESVEEDESVEKVLNAESNVKRDVTPRKGSRGASQKSKVSPLAKANEEPSTPRSSGRRGRVPAKLREDITPTKDQSNAIQQVETPKSSTKRLTASAGGTPRGRRKSRGPEPPAAVDQVSEAAVEKEVVNQSPDVAANIMEEKIESPTPLAPSVVEKPEPVKARTPRRRSTKKADQESTTVEEAKASETLVEKEVDNKSPDASSKIVEDAVEPPTPPMPSDVEKPSPAKARTPRRRSTKKADQESATVEETKAAQAVDVVSSTKEDSSDGAQEVVDEVNDEAEPGEKQTSWPDSITMAENQLNSMERAELLDLANRLTGLLSKVHQCLANKL